MIRTIDLSTGIETIRDYSQEEIQEINSQKAQVPTYSELRRAEYPPMADFLDGFVKNNLDQIQAYKDACMAVKAKYPKPQ